MTVADDPAPLITDHAVLRYRQRVADLPDEAIRAALASPAICLAAGIGAPFVRLPGGQRVVLRRWPRGRAFIATVLPENVGAGALACEKDPDPFAPRASDKASADD